MNQSLKFKWHSIYGQILVDRELKTAWEKVEYNKGSSGIDGVAIEDYRHKLDEKLIVLLQKLRNKQYNRAPVGRQYIPKKNGKKRPLDIPKNRRSYRTTGDSGCPKS